MTGLFFMEAFALATIWRPLPGNSPEMTTPNDVLGLCLKGIVEGPLLRRLLLTEEDFLIIIGANLEQLYVILRYWPDLHSEQLHSDFWATSPRPYAELEVARQKNGHEFGDFRYSTSWIVHCIVDNCFFLLLDQIQHKKNWENPQVWMAWQNSIGMPFDDVKRAYESWHLSKPSGAIQTN